MKSYMRPCSQRCGFTLVELLTTIAVIALLISLLVPALSMVQKTAFKVKQKSQFQSIGIALEGFQTDFGDYPGSYNATAGLAFGYCGAQKLAEAIVGYDGFGFHPQSGFRPDGRNEIDVDGDGILDDVKVYDVVNGIPNWNYQTAAENRAVRKGPYLELEAANAVKLRDLYQAPPANEDTFVLVDMFGKVRNRTTQKKTGMPILYFKANVKGTEHKPPLGLMAERRTVFQVRDNEPIYNAPAPFGGNDNHVLYWTNEQVFYDKTTNPNYPGDPSDPMADPPRPYRSESFILLSAGPDGLYGTADDVYNFDTEQ